MSNKTNEINKDSSVIKVFASSDHHFYHKNIIRYAGRPFDVKDENCVIDNAKLMISRHNEIVRDEDIVLMVGDLSAGLRGRTEHFQGLLRLLRGKKVLVRGNHDHEPDQFYLDAGFVEVVDRIMISDTYICHYPCRAEGWAKSLEIEHINFIKGKNVKRIIHGHIHNKDPNLLSKDGIVRTNVCVDYEPNNFYPVLLEDPGIREYFSEKY